MTKSTCVVDQNHRPTAQTLIPHGSPLRHRLAPRLLLASVTLEKHPLVVGGGRLRRLDRSDLVRMTLALALDCLRRDEALDLGSLAPRLTSLLLGRDLATDDVLPHVVFLRQIKKRTQFVGALRPQAPRNSNVSQARDSIVTRLDDDQVEHRDLVGNDASANALALALAAAHSKAPAPRLALVHEETHARGRDNTLLHREPLLILTAHHFEDVPLILIGDVLAVNLLRQTPVVKVTKPTLIVELDKLLRTRRRVRQIELHGDGSASAWQLFDESCRIGM